MDQENVNVSGATANSSATKPPEKKQQKSSRTFAELQAMFPGIFVDGNKELEEQGVKGMSMVLPGMGLKRPEQEPPPRPPDATAEDWAEFHRLDKLFLEAAIEAGSIPRGSKE